MQTPHSDFPLPDEVYLISAAANLEMTVGQLKDKLRAMHKEELDALLRAVVEIRKEDS